MPTIIDYISAFQDVDNMSTDRYASFDYCFTYFHQHQGNASDSKHLTMSCFVLWSYLASWGMLRGSSQLLQKNPYYLSPLISSIDDDDNKDLYDSKYDLNNWDPKRGGREVMQKIVDCYNKFKEVLKDVNPSITLITKIMLGVYGCIPAFDQYFKKTFKLGSSNLSIGQLSKIYDDSNVQLYLSKYQNMRSYAFDYKTNTQSKKLRYTSAKMIDMYGFTKGIVLSEMEKLKKQNQPTTEQDVFNRIKKGRLTK